MSKVDSNNASRALGSPQSYGGGSGSGALDQMMVQRPVKPAGRGQPRSTGKAANSPQTQQVPQGQGLGRNDLRNMNAEPSRSARNTPRQIPQTKIQRASSQPTVPTPAPIPSTRNVTVTNISERTANSTNNGLRVGVSQSTPLSDSLKLNTAVFVQGNNGTKTSKGVTLPVTSTTIGASAELLRKYPTDRKDTTVTLKGGAAIELKNLPTTPTEVKGKLSAQARIDRQLDPQTTAYGSVGVERVFSNLSQPATTLSAQLGVNKKLTPDGKVEVNVNVGADLPVGGKGELYAGLKANVKLDPNTSVLAELKYSNLRSEARVGLKLEI